MVRRREGVGRVTKAGREGWGRREGEREGGNKGGKEGERESGKEEVRDGITN